MWKKTVYVEGKSGTGETSLGITISFYKKLLASDRFFDVSVDMIKESLRPVSETQSLFTSNLWLRTGSFLLLLKMASDEYETASDRFCERYRHSDLLYSRNGQYKIIDLHFFEKQHVEKYPLIDFFKFDLRKVKFDNNFKIHYDEGSCEIYMKSVAANITKGHHLKRNVYRQIVSIGLSGLIWKVFATIMNLTNEKNKKLAFFADPILASINCDLRLPLDKITYFEDIVMRFICVDKIVYRRKTCYFVDAYVCKSKIMLPA